MSRLPRKTVHTASLPTPQGRAHHHLQAQLTNNTCREAIRDSIDTDTTTKRQSHPPHGRQTYRCHHLHRRCLLPSTPHGLGAEQNESVAHCERTASVPRSQTHCCRGYLHCWPGGDLHRVSLPGAGSDCAALMFPHCDWLVGAAEALIHARRPRARHETTKTWHQAPGLQAGAGGVCSKI